MERYAPHCPTCMCDNHRIIQTKRRSHDIPREITEIVFPSLCNYLKMTPEDVHKEDRRERTMVRKMFIAWRLREEWGLSLPDIGKVMRRNHGSIFSMLKQARIKGLIGSRSWQMITDGLPAEARKAPPREETALAN